jgi:hypothetical protein
VKVAGVACLAGLVLAGCSGGNGGDHAGPTVPSAKLRRAVLQSADLPSVFTQFSGGKIVGSDTQPGPREDLERFGRLGGWEARYRRSGSSTTRGPLVVASFADAFPGTDGAQDDLRAYEDQFKRTVASSGGSARLLDPPSVGDEALALERTLQGTPSTVYFTVAWRYGNVTASVAVDGFEGKLTLSEALAVARKQQQRIVPLTR